MADKVWVIEDEGGAPSGGAGRPTPMPKASRKGAKRSGSPAAAARPEGSDDSMIVLLLAYLLGPFAILTTARGRRSKIWAPVAIFSGIAWIAMAITWTKVPGWFGDRGIAVAVWPSAVFALVLMGFAAWSRAVTIAAGDSGWQWRRVPKLVRRPFTVGVLGFLLPGSGLMLSQYPRRAALALFMVGPLVGSLLVLSQARWLWSVNQAAVSHVLTPRELELGLLALLGLAIVGVLGWMIQALDGVREASFRPDQNSRADWLAATLLVAIVAFGAAVETSGVAREIDRVAAALDEDGFQIAPFYLAHAAMRLDPAEPTYAFRTAELSDQTGRHESATRLRRQLDERWRAYAELRQTTVANQSAPSHGRVAMATPPARRAPQ